MDNLSEGRRQPSVQELSATALAQKDVLEGAWAIVEDEYLWDDNESQALEYLMGAMYLSLKDNNLLAGDVATQRAVLHNAMDKIVEFISIFFEDENAMFDLIRQSLVLTEAFTKMRLSEIWEIDDFMATLYE
jgi:hypothetical protein